MADTAQDAADFAAVLAELHAEESADNDGDAGTQDDAGNDDLGEGDEPTEAEKDEPEEPVEEEPEPSPDAEAVKADLRALLRAGKLKDLAQALGEDPKIFKVNPREFAAMRKGLTDAAAALAAAEAAKTEGLAAKTAGEQLTTAAQATYGAIVAGAKAADAGDWSGAQAAVELMFKRPFQEIVASIARAAKGLDPGQVEVIKLRRELAERDAATARAAAAATETQTTAAQVASVATRLVGTPLEKVKDAAADIVKIVHASKDPTTGQYLKTVKQAYTEVKAAAAARAAELAHLAPGARAKPATPPTAPARTPIAGNRPAARVKLTPEQQAKAEFEAEVKAAVRETEAAERANRRRK